MLAFSKCSHDPAECRKALSGAVGPIIIDTETTGVRWHNRIVSVGIFVDSEIYILFVRTTESSIREHQISLDQLQKALQPLSETNDRIVVFHNAPFDLLMFKKDRIEIHSQVWDTLRMLKLNDPDRGWEPDHEDSPYSVQTVARWDRRFKEALNYKLKDVVKHKLHFDALDFPGRILGLNYDDHVKYLTSDLLMTGELYQSLIDEMSKEELAYYGDFVVPLTPILVQMSFTGFQADKEFIQSESDRLTALMNSISDAHFTQFGKTLSGGEHQHRQWILNGLYCRPRWDHKRNNKRQISLERGEMLNLLEDAQTQRVEDSLRLIMNFKLAKSLRDRLQSLLEHIQSDGRIHSSFVDKQASGRITSSKPNLQQIAGAVEAGQRKEFLSHQFSDVKTQSRNALVASEGCVLIAFDIAQADIRVLAHTVESFGESTHDLLNRLRLEHRSPNASQYEKQLWDSFHRQGDSQALPEFDPNQSCKLAEDFRTAKSDFYTVATHSMLGRSPKDKTERNHMKQTILGIVNGMSASALAKRLKVSKEEAEEFEQRFCKAYPQVIAFRELMLHAFAASGIGKTFTGRPRRSTANWWMVTQPYVELFISYRKADKLWIRVVPLRGNRYTLNCRVLRVVDADPDSPRHQQEIYNDQQGRISSASYRFFDEKGLTFRLPYRNISWRNIRRIRTDNEEVQYEGFDRVTRQLFNHICQGGTADVAKLMMIRSMPLCRKFKARLLLQIHDELVFEVPIRDRDFFTLKIQKILEQPSVAECRVPIVVEPKTGRSFGDLQEFKPTFLSAIVRRVYLELVRVVGFIRGRFLKQGILRHSNKRTCTRERGGING